MFIGIDQSFKETAITILFSPTNYNIYTVKGKGDTPQKKLIYLHQKIKKIIEDCFCIYTEKMNQDPSTILCFIEGGSFGSVGPIFTLGQLSGIILASLYEFNITVKEVTPPQLKKFMTGNGVSDKRFVMRRIREKYGIHFRNDNKADSYVLALMAYNFKHKGEIITKFREEAEVIHKMLKPQKKKKRIRYRRSKQEF